MGKLVSVIIPVYKTEKFIEKCIQSLLSQEYENFEALVVDDGSPDNSIKLAKELVGSDKRFRFFNQKNAGQGSARNLALDKAKGDYIAFLDSDDYYEYNYLSTMINRIESEAADICVCNINHVNDAYVLISKRESQLDKYIIQKDYFNGYGLLTNYMWDKLFKATCFSGMRFDKSIRTYEDTELLFKVLYNKKITSTPMYLYNYVQRAGSTVNSLPKTYIEDRYKVFLSVECFYNQHLADKYNTKQDLERYFYKNYIYYGACHIAQFSNNYDEDIRQLLSKHRKEKLRFQAIFNQENLNKEIKVALALLLVSPNAFKYLHRSWVRLAR